MKKFLFGLVLMASAGLITIGCSENEVPYHGESSVTYTNKSSTEEQEMLQTFHDYLYDNQYIDQNFGRILLTESYVQNVDSARVLALRVVHDDFEGIIYGLKTSESGKLLLPNNDEYLILFDKYIDVDTINNSGRRERYDLNHYHFMYQELEIDHGTVLVDIQYPVPTVTVTSNGTVPSSCTGGSDGDISWGECNNCVNSVCSSDPNCNTICDAIDAIQDWNPTVLGFIDCGVMMAVGCVGVAIAY